MAALNLRAGLGLTDAQCAGATDIQRFSGARHLSFSQNLAQTPRPAARCQQARSAAERGLPVRCSASPVVASASRSDAHSRPPVKLAVFVSGGGSNFRSIHAAILEGRINGEVVVVVSDKPECGGCEYGSANNIPVVAYPRSAKFAPEGLAAQDMVDALKAKGVQYVLLAGYLKLLPPELVAAYPRAILNIHPALLPAFGGKGCYGMKVHEKVVASGARFSGPTIHFVDELFDNGPILAQRVVPVYHTDTPKELQERVLKEEHKLYSEVVAALCNGQIKWREDGIPYIEEVANHKPVLA